MRKSTNTALATLKPSGIRRFTALATLLPDCISLALGEPEFDTPEPVRREATAALERGVTHYPPNNGTPWLTCAIAEASAKQGLAYSEEEIVVTCGATEALASTFAALLNPGDEVIIPTPAFGLYESIVTTDHARAVPLDTTPAHFQITEEALSAVVTERTKAIVITSPNNPTGCLLNADSLDAVARVAQATGIYVVCDDVYNRLVYTEGYERFAVRHPELREQTIVVDSFSKPWAMTGWRMGWLAATGPVLGEIQKAHQYLVSSAASFSMPAAERALSIDPEPMRATYRARRARVLAALAEFGLPCVEPKGAFYAFPSIAELGLGSDEFCTRAIDEAGVALVPGTCFGTEGYVRLSYCAADAELDEGLRRLGAFVRRLRG